MDFEGCGFARVGAADEDSAAVIVLHYALCKGEAQAPASLFGGVAGTEHTLEVLVRNSAPRICNTDNGGFVPAAELSRDGYVVYDC